MGVETICEAGHRLGNETLYGNNIMTTYSFKGKHSYSFPTNIRFGAGVISELADQLKSHELQRPLLVTDPTIIDLAFFNKIVEDLGRNGMEVTVFSETHKNPIKSD